MSARHHEWRRQSHVERLADIDPLFRENYRALVTARAEQPTRDNVEEWLIRGHYRRASRSAEHVPHVNWRQVERLERELFPS